MSVVLYGAAFDGVPEESGLSFPVVTLCGSTRFKRAWAEWHARLELQGGVVFSVAMWSNAERVEVTPAQKALFDVIHLRKIEMSDEIFVLDVGGYIGLSTRGEIEYARAHDVRVRYLSEECPGWTEEDCVLWREHPPCSSEEERREEEAARERAAIVAWLRKCAEVTAEEGDRASGPVGAMFESVAEMIERRRHVV